MSKRLWVMLLSFLLVLNMAIPVFASESEGRNSENGIASGETMLSGEIAYTPAYTLTIPASINNMDLSKDATTTVGEVKVTKQNDNAEFDPAKKVSVTVSYTGELENTKNADKKVLYKLQQNKGESEATDITTDSKLDFSASEIEAGNVAYNLKAVVTETNKAGGVYSGIINFSAQVENATIKFYVDCCGEKGYGYATYEVATGTTWREFAQEDNAFDVDIDIIFCDRRGSDYDGIVYHFTPTQTIVKPEDLIIENEEYWCNHD